MSQLDPSTMSRRQQFAETYRLTKTVDPRIGLVLLATFVVAAVVGFAVFWILPGTGVLGWVMSVIGALLFGALAVLIVFGRRAQNAAYKRMDGQPGAAAAVLGMLRRGWSLEPAVGFTKQQDVVHRVVGPPGIVLVGEGGSQSRVKHLLANERRRHARVAPDAPIHEVVCGNGEGEVELADLVKHVRKLGRKVKPAEQTDILNRLKAIDAVTGKVPLPKGPVPTSMKGMRGNLRGR